MTKPYADQPNNKPIFNDFQTPVGKIVHCFHDKPQLEVTEKTNQPVLDADGIQKANYKVTLWWPRSMYDTALIPLRTLAGTTRDQAWPGSASDSWFRLEPFLRDGDNPEHNTMKKEYLFGGVYLNFKSKAKATRMPDGRVMYSGAPGLVDEYTNDLMPLDIYPGCEARVSGTMFGTEYSGRNFISVRLHNVQRAPIPVSGPWERLGGGGRPDAKSQFDPLATGPAPGAPGLGSIVL
jgi:hypothetical protein